MSRILFVMLHPGFIRYYDGALQALADAGHDVHLAFEVSRTKLGEDVTAQRLATRSPRLTCGTTPPRAASVRDFLARGDRQATRSGDVDRPLARAEGRAVAWESLATTIRLQLDYLRFFEPVFAAAVSLRARAEKRLPRLAAALTGFVGRRGRGAARACAALLHGVERLIPVSPALERFVRDARPDLLLVTPLIELGSQQVDYVKCARRLGIPSALCVASWDNLTSKGLIRVAPDHVVVWNEAQRREAEVLHGIAPSRVAVTGAQVFDRWFAGRPTRTREAFCRLVGIDPALPFVLYVGSSIFIAPEEVSFVERLVWGLRGAGDPAVRTAGVLVRPHPANSRQWRAFTSSEWANVGVWPPIGTDPNADGFWNDYFDSLYHSAAVVGINTSAQIEAAIVGRPVFTICTPEFAHAQAGTLHFQHLVGEGGAVRAAASIEEHVAQLGALLSGRTPHDEEATRRFVARFVRPHGLDVPAAGVFARTIADYAQTPAPRPQADPLWVRALRPLALFAAHAARALAEDRPLWAYALRPAAAGVVGVAMTRHVVGAHWRETGTRLRRWRRAAWRAGYESAQAARRRVRRASKPVERMVRRAGDLARRVLRPR